MQIMNSKVQAGSAIALLTSHDHLVLDCCACLGPKVNYIEESGW